VKSFDQLPILHDKGESGSVIYRYSEAEQDDPNQWIPSGRAWCWQIASPEHGFPVCVFTVRVKDAMGTNWSDGRIYYYYARWTGTNWQKRFIAHAGRPLYQAEGDYAGGICMDPDDPTVVYLSSDAADPFALRDTKHVPLRPRGRFELWRGETSDGGQTFHWRALTTNSTADNLRPFVPQGRRDSPTLLWFRGDYRRYTSFQSEIVGLFSTGTSGTAGTKAHAGNFDILTSASQVRGLTQAEASEHFPVRLRGIVIGEAEPEGESFAMMDSTAGIYLRGSPSLVSRIRHGDVVEIEGHSDPGEFAPFVRLTSLRKTGHETLPEPRTVSFEQLVTGRPDAQWVEVSGVVRSCDVMAGHKYKLELATGGGRLSVQINSPLPLENPIDAEVRLRGVCYYQVNNTRQVLSPLLLVPREVPVIVQSAPPADPYGEPVRSIGSLLQFAPQGSYGHRVHVRGVVTYSDHGKSLWIRDETQGLRVHARQVDVLESGDVVDVLGFPNRGDYTPVLEDAVFQKRASAPSPAPIHLPDASSALNYDAGLVEVPAVLTAWQEAADGWVLVLEGNGVTFRALLRSDAMRSAIEPGSRVRVTGICSVLVGEESPPTGLSAPHSFQILLRSPTDLALVQPPPWWTWERVVWLLGAVVGGLLLVVAIVMSVARRRLREKTIERARAEAEFTAILAERNRMAREIHDTLAQGLGAISMQLELVKGELSPDTNGAGKHLEQARRLVRDSLADARNSIWNMRSQVLETGDLASALSGILRQLAGGTNVEAHIRVIGEPRRLPPVTENNLLRIGQEAITNAMKHAHPRHLSVELEFAGKEVHLRVTDDGKGFNTAAPSTGRSGFGLMGIRERTDELHGALTLESRPGDGTQLTLVVPVTTTT
jgi:signal transduction histidine kinase